MKLIPYNNKCVPVALTNWPVSCVCVSPAAGRAPDGPDAAGLPAAESESADAAATEVLEPREEPDGAGVPSTQADPAAAEPQAALLPQTVASGTQAGHGGQGCPGGTGLVETFSF